MGFTRRSDCVKLKMIRGNNLAKFPGLELLLCEGTFFPSLFPNAFQDSVAVGRIMGMTCWAES